MAKRVLVTGANGLVGSEICSHFREKGYEVVGTVRQACLENGQNIQVDLSESNLDLSAYFKNIDGVIHTAAVVPNRKSIANNEENKLKTINIDKNVYEFCKQQDIPVIYVSSCNLYKLETLNDKDENAVVSPPTLHHEAKLYGEKLFLEIPNAIIARINSPYGNRLSNEAVLKIFLSKAYRNESITIWGSGEREQDFIHVKDIASFAEKAIFSGKNGVFNVASGQQITMKGLADLCIKTCKSGSIESNGQKDPLEGYYPRFSIQKAKKVLNWQPTLALEDGLKDIVKTWKNENE